ncbi:FAD binding domain-containing protein [Micromonospora endophytica]|uniref:FAD-binding molybdopterin dehydrogenase n=1 Tax=Micromonospora endophytica TaxID=515350 RepID=A0A2W2D4S2_9ACTN|nr:xanthine dehydrogenase family protein subunit M [Micromonospora endophytica]PZF98658.1 FAD-binding molybdopterin dehydrogenase [Micromonospora endophytica]RIW45197.1 xanthine dehydrogenase family protein subunit M [Micromonospora endophytica]BCJ59599.1 carbon-monoxide dehydrogenase medium subunit [Micromonospora endophytica]
MRAYTFTQPRGVREALADAGTDTAFLAGGTTLVDLMKLDVVTPARVVDINRLPLRGITLDRDGLHIGALERMSDVAADRNVRRDYPMIAQALELSASAQLRNMASIGGNLLQRTRCGYFRDVTTPCNKREPGSGCSALTGINRTHAILGTSDACVATHPSDLAVALVALGTDVHLVSGQGTRTVPLDTFYTLPGSTPHLENVLRPGELIAGITVPRSMWAANSVYLKIRDRQSYEFALTSAAVAVEWRGRTIRQARIAAGGVGTKPWRLPAVESALAGQPATADVFEAAVSAAADGARPLSHNGFKPALLRRTLVRALTVLAESR